MRCPKCENDMDLLKQDISKSKIHDKTYDRSIYACANDEVWVTVEIPRLQPALVHSEKKEPVASRRDSNSGA
jgi:hypothetical protein